MNFQVGFPFFSTKSGIMKYLLFILALFFVLNTDAQLRKIPAEVTTSFKEQYPSADSVEWRDRLTGFSVGFLEDDIRHTAHYSNEGEWQSTETEINYEELPELIKDSHSKTRYADWETGLVHKIELPDEELNYRIQVIKNDLQKKNLYFNEKGRLVKDKISL